MSNYCFHFIIKKTRWTMEIEKIEILKVIEMKELIMIGQEVEDHRQNKNTMKSESRVFSWSDKDTCYISQYQ